MSARAEQLGLFAAAAAPLASSAIARRARWRPREICGEWSLTIEGRRHSIDFRFPEPVTCPLCREIAPAYEAHACTRIVARLPDRFAINRAECFEGVTRGRD